MSSNLTGRPYVAGITEALLQAAERIMANDGYSALTIDGLVSEVGTTRPTFYRRFPNIAHIALSVVKARFGTGADVDTGSLFDDLLLLQREEIAMFASPLMRKNLPGLLEAARVDDSLRELCAVQFIGPRRANVARVINAAVQRGEVDGHELDIDFVCDLLLGPILSRALLPANATLDDRLARRTAESALRELRRTAPPAG